MECTIHADRLLLPGGWADDAIVRIENGRILSVASTSPVLDDAKGSEAAPSAEQSLAAIKETRSGEHVHVDVLLPALANLHSHAFQRAMAGMTEARGPDGNDSFWTWRRLMYRFLDRLDPDQVETIAAQVQVEMLEAGYASVGEFHYLHHAPNGIHYNDVAEMSSRVAAAAARTGIGLTHLPVLYSQGGSDGRPLTGGQLRFGNDLDGFSRLLEAAALVVGSVAPDAMTGVAPHSLRAVGVEALTAVQNLLPAAPVHMHIAEQRAEVVEILATHGATPVKWLLEIMDVDHRWCLIHATHMTPAETEGLARSGAVAGLCPITEANLGDGIFNGANYLSAGGRIGIGSDSNIRISASEELRILEYGQRLRDHGRAVIAGPQQSTGRTIYDAALLGGAQAMGRESGSIAEGKWADLVAINANDLALAGLDGDALLDGWIFAGDDRVVTDVWSAGRHVVKDGRHVARDEIERAYRLAIADLRADL